MIGLLLFSFLIGCVLAYDGVPQLQYDLEHAEEYFSWFIKTHNKTYYRKSDEKLRFEIFKHNLRQINKKNAAHGYIVFGINQFSDLTSEEFRRSYTGLKKPAEYKQGSYCDIIDENNITVGDLPREFDWRTKNKVTSVKHQHDCGSCWAFATIGNIESLHAIKTNELVDLSVQQLVECDPLDCGCCGGLSERALKYLTGVGVATAKNYSPIAEGGDCRITKPRVLLDGCLSYDFTDEEKLRQVLVHSGPAIIGIDSTDLHSHIQYQGKGGLILKCNAVNGINHAVLLVGYGEENGVPYWIIKNSWGDTWGDHGYFRVMRGINACGMLNSFVNFAVLSEQLV